MIASRVRSVVLGRLGGWPRRALAVALLALAGVLALVDRATGHGPAPPPDGTVVLTAARDLAAGTSLDRDDVMPVRVPRGLVPAGALTGLDDVKGRRLAAPARRGETLTDVRLVGSQLTAGLRESEQVAVPLRLADAGIAALLRPGDRVDVLATPTGCAATAAVAHDIVAAPEAAIGTCLGAATTVDPTADPLTDRSAVPDTAGPTARLVAADLTVLAVTNANASAGGDMTGGALVVVAAGRQTASHLAGAASSGPLTVTLKPP